MINARREKNEEIKKDKKELYCLCQIEWQNGAFYIGCDYCQEWMMENVWE